MERYLDSIVPKYVPEDMEEFKKTAFKLVHDCKYNIKVTLVESTRNGRTVWTEVHEDIRPSVMTITSLNRKSCDHCHKNGHDSLCTGEACTAWRLLWIFCRHFRKLGWKDERDFIDLAPDTEVVGITAQELRELRYRADPARYAVRRSTLLEPC